MALKRCFFSVTKLDHTFAEARFSASSRLLVAGKNTTLSMVWISSSWTTQRINNEVNSSSGVSSETRDYNVIRVTAVFKWLSKVMTLTEWLQNFAPPFQPMQQNRIQTRVFFFFFLFFPRFNLSTSQAISRNSDWFIAPFAPVVIGRSNYFVSQKSQW